MEIAVEVVKWLSQILILLAGASALFSDTHKQDPATGRRMLTRSGRIRLSLLVVGLVLFMLTEYKNRVQQREAIRKEMEAHQEAIREKEEAIREREERIKWQNETIQKQDVQLKYLRRLFLLQNEVSAVEVSWPLSGKDLTDFSQSLLGYGQQVKAESELKTNLQYINTAFKNSLRSGNNWLNVRQLARGQFGLQVLVSRPLGTKLMQFSEEQPEWKAFDTAIRQLLGDRFEIEAAPGVVFADLARKHWPCELSIDSSVIRFTVEKPGISLGQIEGANVTFWGGNINATKMPKRLRLRFKDPKVALDQQFELKWKEIVLFSAINEDGYEVKYSNLKAGPFKLSATIKYDLLIP